MSARWAGIDIGGTKTLVLLCDDNGDPVAEAVAPTPARAGGESIMDNAAALVTKLLSDTGGELAGAGVGAAGVVDAEQGVIVTTGDSFTGWAGTAVNHGLEKRLNVPVTCENDVRAFLVGELDQASERPRHAMAVTLGTGVGGALLVDGRLLHGGATGAGEIGHIGDFGPEPCPCGRRGHLEAYASGRSLARRYTELTGRELSGERIAEAAASGDATAAVVFEEAGRHLGTAIALTGGLLGLDLAILGGSVMNSWWLLENSVNQALRALPLLSGQPVRVRLSRLGGRAVAIGAAVLARSR